MTTERPEDQLIDYDHLELEDPAAAAGLLSSDALKLGNGNSNGLGGISNSTSYADNNNEQR